MSLVFGCGDTSGDEVAEPTGPDSGGIVGGGVDGGGTGGVADDSCVNRCGAKAPSGCGCDNDCFTRGDCCFDRQTECGPFKPPVPDNPEPSKSCKGQCGHLAPSGCSCKDGCEEANNCCHDKKQFCGETVSAEDPVEKTCEGFCGKKAPTGCWCHNECHENGSCCPDKVHFCGDFKPPPVEEPGKSCEGICGQQADSGCWCNNDCHENNDCCEDKVLFCGEFEPPPVEDPSASCEGICGQQADSGCWCDNGCHEFGNCCEDKVTWCGEFNPPVETQCDGFCGEMSPAGCWCNNECHANDNCCEDKVQFCGAFVPPEEPDQDSCLGICGQQAPGGCWCHNDCHLDDSCCGDKELQCGEFDPPDEPLSSCQGICGAVAQSGCWCNNECHANDNCCADKVEACGPAPDSCIGRCGEEAPSGCSCIDGCETEATCCPDKVDECGSPPEEAEGSCEGLCGEQTPQGCWCDELCEFNEDCCDDVTEHCGAVTPIPEGSCAGICGDQAPEGCWCDDTCHSSNDCCPDKEAQCGGAPEPDTATCQGICGEQAASGCWCDVSCEASGDCCQDKQDFCGATTCESLGHSEGPCLGILNGTKCGEEGAYTCTTLENVGMNCWVLTEACTPTQVCEDPLTGPAKCVADEANPANSCNNLCGQQAPGGCWCDSLCEQQDDCCPDKEAQCGETTCEDLGHPKGGCSGILNGSKCEENQPFNCQPVGILKCWVQSDTCTEAEICEDPLGPTGAHCEADPNNALNSCADNCDGQAPSGCWCDAQCDANGDCCPDKDEQCGGTTCEQLGFDLGECGFFSGSKCEEGQPHACQEQGSLSCWVQTDICGEGDICVDPFGPTGAHCEADPDNEINSCAGVCGGQAPGGCWCDDQCETNDDCCPDKEEQCGEATCESLGFDQGQCGVFSGGSKCADNNAYECQSQGPFSCWVLSEGCAEGFVCKDPLGPTGASCVVDDGSPLNSCAGNCGGQAPGGCYCDAQCEQTGDCCADKEEQCGGTTCEQLGFEGGECGTFSGSKCEGGNPWECIDQGPVSCWVQTATCADNETCTDPITSGAKCVVDPENPDNSCAGNCGGQAPGGCFCDEQCEQTGDCCEDKNDVCGASTCEGLGHELGSCGFFDGSKCEGGQPYECQDIGDLDCWVQTETCEPGQECVDPFGPTGAHCQGEADPGPDPNSCKDLCGEQAPGGCWCDELCEANEDCCEDKATECPPE